MRKVFSAGLIGLLFVTLAGCATGGTGNYPSASAADRRGDEPSATRGSEHTAP